MKNYLLTLLIALFAVSSFAQTAAELNKKAEEIINEDPDKSLGLAKNAIAKAKTENDKEQEALAYLNYGTALYYLDEYSKAVKEINKGIELAKEIENKDLEGRCECIIGEIYVYTAEYEKSLEYLSKARKIFEENGNNTELARCNNNMGIIHKNQFNLNEAIVYFKKALEIGDDVRKGDASLYLGQVYIQQKKFTDADIILKEAVAFAQKNKDNFVLADAYIGLGEVNANFGKKDQALFYLQGALKIKEEVEDQQGIANVNNSLGNLYLQNNDANAAHICFLKAANIASAISTKEELKDAFLGLSNTFHLRDVDDSAYLFLDRYNKLNEEILSEEASKKLTQIEEALTAEKQKQQEEHERFINRVYTFVFIGIILVLMVFGYVMYNRFKLKKKAHLEITRQKEEVEKQKQQVEQQKAIIEEKNHEITDSINYAKRIQNAVIPSENDFFDSFEDSFVLFKPKDIVSGDFYWITKVHHQKENRRPLAFNRGETPIETEEKNESKELIIYATADCTGHGVPGGFMSMLGTSLLNEIINEREIHEPAKALDMLREKVIAGLKQTGASGENKDGMDIVLASIDRKERKMIYSAANNGFYIIRNNALLEFDPDKQPIGYYGDAMKPFSQNEIQLEPGDCIYTFTDGYADQFGGPKGKKFKYKAMEEKLMAIHKLPMSEQKIIMDQTITEWQGDLEQNDDICMIGVRI